MGQRRRNLNNYGYAPVHMLSLRKDIKGVKKLGTINTKREGQTLKKNQISKLLTHRSLEPDISKNSRSPCNYNVLSLDYINLRWFGGFLSKY